MGVINYSPNPIAEPKTYQTSDIDLSCKDEDKSIFSPVLQWNVPPLTNGGDLHHIKATIHLPQGCKFPATIDVCDYWMFDRSNIGLDSAPLWLDLEHPSIEKPADQGATPLNIVELTPTVTKNGERWYYLLIEDMFRLARTRTVLTTQCTRLPVRYTRCVPHPRVSSECVTSDGRSGLLANQRPSALAWTRFCHFGARRLSLWSSACLQKYRIV